MRKTKRSAFTIVELVIVIAVIAVLSAVLIPTFGAIIKNANVASDQATAATLTSELHVYLKGETIDSEEELMDVLSDAKSGIGKKLVPKAAAYGNHFWFDMDNQMIIAKTAKEIEELVKEKNSNNESLAIKSGVQFISDVQPLAETTSLNVSFRSLLGGNFYLIEQGGSAFVNALSTIAEFDCTKTHSELVSAVNLIFADIPADDQAFADRFNATLASTVIITEDGVAQPSTASYVYFEPGIEFVNNHGTISSITSGTVELPSSVVGVAANALVFGSTEVVLKTSCKDASDVEFVFANASTNATIKTADDSYKIAQADGTVTINETNALANKIVPVNTISNNTGKIVEGITLSSKLTCKDFEIYVEAGVPGDNKTIAYNTASEDPTLYVSYLDYAKTGANIVLSLLADGENVIEGANSAITWNYKNNNTYNIALTNDVETATVTAEARNVDGIKLSKTLNIVVVKPTYAELTINGQLCVKTGATNTYTWDYSGRNDTIPVAVTSTTYNEGNSPISPDAKIELSVADSNITVDENNLVLAKDESGEITAGIYTVTITVNDCLTHTVDITVNDNSDTLIETTFKYTEDELENGIARDYYVGADTEYAITLANLVGYADPVATYSRSGIVENITTKFGKATVEFSLADDDTDITKVMTIKIDDTEYKGSFEIDDTDNYGWLSKNLYFDCDEDIDWNTYEDGLTLRMTITPEGNAEKGIPATGAFSIDFKLVDGINILSDSSSALKTAADKNCNVIMFSDIDLASTLNASNYTLDIGVGETLYGNGFIIDAKNFFSTAIETFDVTVDEYKYCNTCKKEVTGLHSKYTCSGTPSVVNKTTKEYTGYASAYYCLIDLAGKLNNVYIDGPTYDTAQYNFANYVDVNGKQYSRANCYVAGVNAKDNAEIINSYLSGFRNPVQVSGSTSTTVTLKNTTLYGGALANLAAVGGNLKLDNVTTVQDAGNSAISKIGAGILVEKDNALTSDRVDVDIEIVNSLKQYNWFCEDYIDKLPSINLYGKDLPLSTLGGFAFNDAITDKMGELIHPVGEGENAKKYINTGIVYLATSDSNDLYSTMFEGSDFNGGSYSWASRETSIDEIYAHPKLGGAIQAAVWLVDLDNLKAAFSLYTYKYGSAPSVTPDTVYSTVNNFYSDYLNR